MNTRSSKRHQVVSTGNKTEIKKSKIDKTLQISSIGVNETFKGGKYLIFCKDSAQKCFQEKSLCTLNCSTDPGNDFFNTLKNYILFQNDYRIIFVVFNKLSQSKVKFF